jgi:hypothetical protein
MSEPTPSPATSSEQPRTERPHTGHGFGRVLVAVYGLLALVATGRSILQITEYFDRAPVPFLLSALAALIYLVATVGLARGDRASVRLATIALTVELVGVLAVGVWSVLRPEDFPAKTVWSHFGQGYGYVPLVLPLVGLWWIRRTARATAASEAAEPQSEQ